ncbi:MAG: ribosome biogenesis GTPase Der [Clostridiales Family XIII bacterium]|jgi:GTP-binding protein|nr:ribosome biogenesis GTPase Der [Clostridiales Family XIII bacterium]
MSLPIVAIIGRPNVGKSTFFNRIVGGRVAIVEDTPGVTRDRIYAEAEWNGKAFALVDTGGIDPDTDDVIPAQMREQAQAAMDMATVIIFIVDGKEGLTPADEDVAQMLRRTRTRVVLVVNKADGADREALTYDFYALGLGDPVAVSAANMTGLGDALDAVAVGLPDSPDGEEADEDDDSVRVAVIGKPNVGKSSLINALIGEDRLIVSDIAGTTRDAIDTPFESSGRKFTLIDTAGIRRRARVTGNIERYSVARAIAAIERSDVCLLMIDAQDGVTDQDKRIAGLAHESGKGIVVVVNKWDLIEKETGTLERYREKVRKELPFMSYAPELFISVATGQRFRNVMDMAEAVAENRAMRVPTGKLNSLVRDAMLMKPPPSAKGKSLKIYYAAQVSVKPPLFSFQVNSRSLMHFSYARYLENRIRDAYGFAGTPIKFVFREKEGNSRNEAKNEH